MLTQYEKFSSKRLDCVKNGIGNQIGLCAHPRATIRILVKIDPPTGKGSKTSVRITPLIIIIDMPLRTAVQVMKIFDWSIRVAVILGVICFLAASQMLQFAHNMMRIRPGEQAPSLSNKPRNIMPVLSSGGSGRYFSSVGFFFKQLIFFKIAEVFHPRPAPIRSRSHFPSLFHYSLPQSPRAVLRRVRREPHQAPSQLIQHRLCRIGYSRRIFVTVQRFNGTLSVCVI